MSGYKQFSDLKLLNRLKCSDELAYTEIYHRYFELVFIQAYKKLSDEEQAKDIVQDVFVNLWTCRESAPLIKNVAGYLVTSVRNRVFNLFASLGVRSKYVQSLADYQVNISTVYSDHLIREKEFALYIDKAINALPSKMKLIFKMSRNEHLSHKQIAEKLGTSEMNVSKQITNALKILRTKLTIVFMMMGC